MKKALMKPINFLKSVVEEGRKVEWLSFGDAVKYSIMVIIFTIVATLFIAFWDVFFIRARGITMKCLGEGNFVSCAIDEIVGINDIEEIEDEIEEGQEEIEDDLEENKNEELSEDEIIDEQSDENTEPTEESN